MLSPTSKMIALKTHVAFNDFISDLDQLLPKSEYKTTLLAALQDAKTSCGRFLAEPETAVTEGVKIDKRTKEYKNRKW